MIPLSGFTLHEPIGHGGMAEVWGGTHDGAGIGVAVKVITNPRILRDRGVLQHFSSEVRAIGGLWHPHIVRVLDMGTVPRAASDLTEGKLPEGAPFVVMELVEGGSLRPLVGRLEWHQLQTVLLSLLDALAHAHARGVVHCDIKPGNVLLGGSWQSVKLTDFGLAHAMHEAAHQVDEVLGTPSYMAPEQFRGNLHEIGPATDLYALGCLTYALVTGTPPFGRLTGDVAHTPHMLTPAPPMQPKKPIPTGLHAWVHRLLEKEPEGRFHCAADAAWALMGIQDGELTPAHQPNNASDDELSVDLSTLTFVRDMGDQPAADGWIPPLRTDEQPTFPGTWRRPMDTDDDNAPQLSKVLGIGIYRLRDFPMIDRVKERDRLWGALERAHQGQPTVLAMVGPGGTSRLARWLCERATEVGVATALRARFTPIPTEPAGLRPMAQRVLGCVGIEDKELRMAQITRRGHALGFHGEDELSALYALVADDGPVVLRHQRERFGVMIRLIRRLAQFRPVVLWLDDLQWSLDAFDFLGALYEELSREPAPVLLVVTAREDLLAEQKHAQRIFTRLLSQAQGEVIQVGPLTGAASRQLVNNLVGFDEALAHSVDMRTGGNPQFAIQLVGDWVDRGLLIPGPNGFRLKPGSQVDLPEDLYTVWRQRLQRFLAGRGEHDAQALALAAVFSLTLNASDWRMLNARAGFSPSASLIDDLIAVRLAQSGPSGPQRYWSFVHGMLRECLIRMASEMGDATRFHRLCAKHLAGRPGGSVASRLADHLAAAGESEAAAHAWLQAIRLRRDAGMSAEVRRLCQRLAQHIRGHEVSDDIAGKLAIAWAQLAEADGDWVMMRREALSAVDHAPAQAMDLLGRLCWREGNLDEALGWLKKAHDAAVEQGEPDQVAMVLVDQAELLLRSGQRSASSKAYVQARRILDRGPASAGKANCLLGLAEIRKQEGQLDRALALLDDAKAVFTEMKSQSGLAGALNNIGDVHRMQGDLTLAESHYISSVRVLEAMGLIDRLYPLVNRALVAVEVGNFVSAESVLDDVEQSISWVRRELEGLVLLIRGLCEAHKQNWDEVSSNLTRAEARLAQTKWVDVDIMSMAGRINKACKKRPDLAKQAHAIELTQKAALRREG